MLASILYWRQWQMVQMGKIEIAGERLSRAGIPPVPPVHPAADRHFKDGLIGSSGPASTMKQGTEFDRFVAIEWFKAEARMLAQEQLTQKMNQAAQDAAHAANPSSAEPHLNALQSLAEEFSSRIKRLCKMEGFPDDQMTLETEKVRALFEGTVKHHINSPLQAIFSALDPALADLYSNSVDLRALSSAVHGECNKLADRLMAMQKIDSQNPQIEIYHGKVEIFKI
ncbi:Uncharacterised protein [Candidatus Anstonella stagnisolia]|nr:Uncharacterised protein [Candidatus Anstonella stagnisolia]